MQNIPVVFSTDHNYITPTGVTICSLLLNKGEEEYDIYVLISSDVTENDKEKIRQQVENLSHSSTISFIEMGNSYAKGYEIRGISIACYYRLMIPWLLPQLDKVIYCDVDIIFKTGLEKLYNFNLEDNYVAGSLPNTEEGWKLSKKYFDKIGLNYKDYINSGVLIINSKLQREDSLDKLYNSLSKNKYLYQDQDIINIICKGRIAHFPKKYNLMPQFFCDTKELSNNVIIHFAGDKPWNTFTYAWDEWWHIYKKSNFFNGSYYIDICKKIVNPKQQLKYFLRKAKNKAKQFLAQYS